MAFAGVVLGLRCQGMQYAEVGVSLVALVALVAFGSGGMKRIFAP